MTPTPVDKPRRLGDFEILRELGRGGMGIVYEARQLSLNRKVALKVLAGSLGITPTAVMRFRREAEAATKLHNTNIVPSVAVAVVHDAIEPTGLRTGLRYAATNTRAIRGRPTDTRARPDLPRQAT